MAESSGDPLEDPSDETPATEPDPSSAENGDESSEFDEENYVQVLDPQGDPDSDDLAPTLWGRFWGMGEGESVAFYWQFDPWVLNNSNSFENDVPSPVESDETGEPETAEGEGNGQDDESDSELFNEQLYAAFGEPASLETYDPGLRRAEFKRRLRNYTVDDSPVPQVMIEDLRDQFSNYLEKPKIVWLQDFIESGEHSEINGWFSRLLEVIDPQEEYRYQLRGQLVDPTEEEIEVIEESSEETPETEEEEDADEASSSVRTLSISLMTDPSNGVEPTELVDGMEVFFRIVGDVEFLPEKLIDRDRQETASTPMTGRVVSIESDPEIPGDRDADPENYRKLEVEIDDGIHGKGLAFKDDRVKVPIEDDETDEFKSRDIALLALLVGLLLIIVLLILYL